VVMPGDEAQLRWSKAPCRFCGTGCGVMVAVKDGQVVANHGDILAEVPVILEYLADQVPAARLLPKLGDLGAVSFETLVLTHPHPDHARGLLALLRLAPVERVVIARGAARNLFLELGARLWTERTEAELGRIGGRAPADGVLTPTEQRIAELVAEGRTNKEIAAVLVVAERTVESALTQIYRKLDVRSRTELTRRILGPG